MPIDDIRTTGEMPGFGERAALVMPRIKEQKPKPSRLPLEAGRIYSEFENEPDDDAIREAEEEKDRPKDPMERENLRNEIRGLESSLREDEEPPEQQKAFFDDPEMVKKAQNLNPEEEAKFWQHVAGLYTDFVKKGKWEEPSFAKPPVEEKPNRKAQVAEALKGIVTDEAELADILKRIE